MNRSETPQVWKIPVEQVQANVYNLAIKNPYDTSVAHTDPDELLADYQLPRGTKTSPQLFRNEFWSELGSPSGKRFHSTQRKSLAQVDNDEIAGVNSHVAFEASQPGEGIITWK